MACRNKIHFGDSVRGLAQRESFPISDNIMTLRALRSRLGNILNGNVFGGIKHYRV